MNKIFKYNFRKLFIIIRNLKFAVNRVCVGGVCLIKQVSLPHHISLTPAQLNSSYIRQNKEFLLKLSDV